MKHSFKTFIGAAAVASIVFAAGTASADDDTKCHQTIAKNITKYQATLAKNQIGCHKSRTGEKILASVQCNNAIQADQKGKRLANREKARAKIVDTCAAATPAVLARYVACPSPVSASDDLGATVGIDDFTEVANCLLDLSESYIDDIGEELMGNPTIPASDAAADCQGAVGKAYSKMIKTIGGNRAKCQANEEKALAGLDYDASCANADPSGKIAPSITAVATAITTSCSAALLPTTADWLALGNCVARDGTPTPADYIACGLTKVASPIGNGLAAAAQELPGTCAAVADVIINAGYGVKPTATRLDSGWKGTAHNVDVVDQAFGAVELTGCDADCRNCDVQHNPKNGNCRCDSDPGNGNPVSNALIECDEIEVADTDCPGNAVCHCMFGPPLAISASSTPVCIVNRFVSDFTGSTGEVGEYDVLTTTRALVHTGLSHTQPCPTCEGGFCDGGLRDNLNCTVDADHPDFGPVSFDCPPSPGANISGSGLLLALNFESGSASLTASRAPGTDCAGADNCHCNVCVNDHAVGCATNADCSIVGGNCGIPLLDSGVADPQQTSCTGGAANCTNDGNGNGECSAGPIDNYCDGFVHGNNNGIISCSTDGDCNVNDCNGDDVNTPGECGTCSLPGFRQCFLPTVSATGTPGIFNSEGVSVFCSGQTGNSGVDGAGGLPGPGRVKLDFDFNLYCADGTTQFQLPEGSNCVP